MRKTILLILALVSLGIAQARFGHGGGSSLDLTTLLPIIADSTDWTAGSTVHAIKPKAGKTVEADSAKVGALEVTGNARFNSNVTMITTAGEQVQLGTGSDAAPELAGAGDTNTGIRFPGGDKMQLVQGGVNSHTFRPYRYSMFGSDGDTLSISMDGTYVRLVSNALFIISGGAVGYNFEASRFYSSNDLRSLGDSNNRWQNEYISDNIYLGGKGQTATQYISQENTIAGKDSSMKLWVDSGSPKLEMRFGATDASCSNGKLRTYFGPDTLALFNGARTGRDSTVYILPDGSFNISGTTTATLLNIKQNQAELITAQVNRDFSGAGNWTGANWAVSGGKLLHTAGATTAATLAYGNFTASSILSGYPYELTFTVSGLTAGTVTPALGTYTYSAIAANGTYTIYINTSVDDGALTFTPTANFNGALDNISMKLVENAQYVKGGILYHNGIQSVGGNARGIGAIDLQVYRISPTQVASGNYSTASGNSTTASGNGSTASGNGSTASGNYSTASGLYSTASHYGARAHAAGRFTANGDAQFSSFVLRDTTLSSQADTLKLDGTEAVTTGYLTIAANQALYFEGKVIAWCVAGTKDDMAAAYKIEGLIQRDGSNNTTLVWSSVTDKYEHADLAAALSVTLSANDTKECLNIICAGMTAQTIRWVATIDAVQVGG